MSSETRSSRETIANKIKFLDAVRNTGNVTAAARLTNIGRRTHYDWIEDDAQYATDFAAAMDEAADLLEVEARRRAMRGIEKGVFYKGRQVAVVREYSDLLLMFLLNGARPEKYKHRHSHEHSGPKGGPIRTIRTSDVDLLKKIATVDEIRMLRDLNRRALAAGVVDGEVIDDAATTRDLAAEGAGILLDRETGGTE